MNKPIYKGITLVVFFVSVFATQMQAQEINAKVTIDHRQIQGTNVSVFNTLETALTEFVNNQRWSNDEYLPNERVDCNFFINLSSVDDNVYSGSLTVTARRPIYNASISTTILNLVDNDFEFTYNEFDQLIFNKNSLTQDLTAVFAFYAYTVLGIDADTFRELGGSSFYDEAMSIVNSAQSASALSEGGWDRLGSKRNRHVFISELLSSDFTPLRRYLYQYHRQGLDVMAANADQGSEAILDGLNSLEQVVSKSPSSYTMLLFFDVKTDEIQSIIREMDTKDEAVATEKAELITKLKKLDPSRVKEYDKLSN